MANTKVRTFRIPEKLWHRVDAIAKENNKTKTDVIIDALEYLLERVEN